jgi:hypothetical protein
LVVGRAQRDLRVDPSLARHVDRGEQQVAELVTQALLELGHAGSRVARHRQWTLEQGRQLAVLLGDLGEGLEHVVPVEADGGGALLYLAREQQRR